LHHPTGTHETNGLVEAKFSFVQTMKRAGDFDTQRRRVQTSAVRNPDSDTGAFRVFESALRRREAGCLECYSFNVPLT
jgi:hypothetical protein